MSTYSYTNTSIYEAIKQHYLKFDAYINLTMYPRGEQNPQRVYSGHISELPAKNQQPQRIYVIEDAKMLAKLDTLTPCRYNAPTVLIFTYNTDEDWKNPNEEGIHAGIEDVSIVATHIMLQAAELGLGTTWCNMFGNTALEKAFDLPANERSVLFMDLGYPAADAGPSPRHTEKKPLEATVKYLK